MKSVQKILEELNTVDENINLEVKKGTEINKSILETICAFSNEPNLGGGIIALGIERDEQSLFPSYIATGVKNSDKVQADIASQCSSSFNIPIRPIIKVENISGKIIIKIYVKELSTEKKPLYFKNKGIPKGIPKGIYRRIGSTDQTCTEDDLSLFFSQEQPNFDATILQDSSLDDLSENAVNLYKKYREKVSPNAEELQLSTNELLYALRAIKKEQNTWKLTYTGALVFGNKLALRRLLPMCRVDYIRILGKQWVEDPDKRFETTIDFRGSLLELLPRTIATIADDLPKGFYLPEKQLQAETRIGLPYRVLREAIVNAFIHRSYKVNSPIQIIRYSNRIEIKNAGYSLKSIDTLGESGSVIRNPNIAAIFHDANIAETKGTGIKTMKKLLNNNQMMLPTYESNHTNNEFTLRLLLHHFLGEKDHNWLTNFNNITLNDEQKTALIFIREVGAIDNQSYRQLTGCNSTTSTTDLRKLCNLNILQPKGKTKATYYTVAPNYYNLFYKENPLPSELNPKPSELNPKPSELNSKPSELPSKSSEFLNNLELLEKEPYNLTKELVLRLKQLGKKEKATVIEELILALCTHYHFHAQELAKILKRNETHLKNGYLNKMVKEKKLSFTIPDVVNHPKQAYKTVMK